VFWKDQIRRTTKIPTEFGVEVIGQQNPNSIGSKNDRTEKGSNRI
jgi:hypothetical protein